jgi:hypothetical protein
MGRLLDSVRRCTGLGLFAIAAALLSPASARATTFVPVSDADLQARADVIVHGVVTSSDVTVDEAGRPETLTFIEPLSVLKGQLSGPLVLHQLGGVLPDGRFFGLYGKPEYTPGSEVVVFAIHRTEGEFQTAEMMLGKFEVHEDESGARFAVSDLTLASRTGISVIPAVPRKTVSSRSLAGPIGAIESDLLDSESGPRPLARFLTDVRTGHFRTRSSLAAPRGALKPVRHSLAGGGKSPQWGYINNSLYRYTNGATVAWTIANTANVTGGGISQTTAGVLAWTNDPNSNINYTVGAGTSSIIDLSAPSSSCGWSTCLPSGGGVIGCGGPTGAGSNSWRGDTYFTIIGGHVDVRPFCNTDEWAGILQSVVEHELGHTLGLGHSDQNVSPHDACRGDENLAIMRSVAQNRTSLGTDDQDAIRWLYGDGLNSCSASAPAPAPTGLTPSFGSIQGGTVVTIVGTGFQPGATVLVGGLPATGVTVVSSSTIRATTAAHAAGAVDAAVTNPDAQSGTLAAGYLYNSGAGFYTVTPCRLLDTRSASGPLGGPSLAANGDRTFVLTGHCGIPSSARAVSVNVTVTQSSTPGDVRLSATGGVLPVTSSINYRAGQTRANNVMVGLGANGGINTHCDQTAGGVNLVVDVNGYFQ